MGREIQRRPRVGGRLPGHWLAWLIFFGGLLVFAWGCTSPGVKRTAKKKDQLPLDQYDRFLGQTPRHARSRRAQPRQSNWGSGNGWLDGPQRRPRRQARQPNPQWRQSKAPPANTPVGRCLQIQQSISQQQCLLPLLTRGASKDRRKHHHKLLRSGYPGTLAVFRMLKSGGVDVRTFLMRTTLQDKDYIRTIPVKIVKSFYNVARQDFLEALAHLPVDNRIQVASKLVRGLYMTRKGITKEFRPYLKLPAALLWTRIRQETALPSSMALVSLSGCTKGKAPTASSKYTDAMLSLELYHSIWRVWNYAAHASGMRQYLKALRAYRRGYGYRPRARINRKALRLAIFLARKLNGLKPVTNQKIQKVQNSIPRLRMKNWFTYLLSQSPRIRHKQGARPPAKKLPKKGGRIEL